MGAKCSKTDKEERIRRQLFLEKSETSTTLLDRYATLSRTGTALSNPSRPQSQVSGRHSPYPSSPQQIRRTQSTVLSPQEFGSSLGSTKEYEFRASNSSFYPLGISEIKSSDREKGFSEILGESSGIEERRGRKFGSSGFFESSGDISSGQSRSESTSAGFSGGEFPKGEVTSEQLGFKEERKESGVFAEAHEKRFWSLERDTSVPVPVTPPPRTKRRRLGSNASSIESKNASSVTGGQHRLSTIEFGVDDLIEEDLKEPPKPASRKKAKKMTIGKEDGSGGTPEFLREMSDVAVKVGTRTRLLVEIDPKLGESGEEILKVSWFRNDQKITFPLEQSIPRIQQTSEGRFHYLDIFPVITDDEGKWVCTAENFRGRTSCTCQVKVMVPKSYRAPEFVEGLRALLTEAGTVSLECKVIGTPTPLLKWYKDGVEIKAGDIFALRGDPSSLGVYTCEATNCMGSVTSSSRVHMNDPSSASGKQLQILYPLQDSRVRVGERLNLQVSLSNHLEESYKVVWYNKSHPSSKSERVIQRTEGNVCSLYLNPVEIQDDGEWICEISSEKEKVASSCILSILVPRNYRKPKFLEDLKAILTEEGLVSFECKVCGFPTPILHWFKDGYELKPGDVYQLSGANSLGRYSCIAHNCMGDAESSTELTLEDIQHQLSDDERKQLIAEGVGSRRPPKFIVGLKSLELKIGEPCELNVEVNDLNAAIQWVRDGTVIEIDNENESKYSEKKERGNRTLVIKELEFEDQAEWKCTASNEYGHSITCAGVKLSIPAGYKKPKFLESLRAVLSEEGTVNLECKVIGVPVPILKWYKDGVELKAGDIHRIISGADGTCCLGTYMCVAKNCMGEVSSSAALLGFEDKLEKEQQQQQQQSVRPNNVTRDPSLSTIMEERTSQMLSVYETPPMVPKSLDEDIGGARDVSVSIDGKDVSVSLYETPDLTENDARAIIEMFANEYSEYISEHNVIPLPSLRFVKETSTSGNIVMEAVVIDVTDDPFDTAKSAPIDGVLRDDPTDADYNDDEFSASFESPMELSAASDLPEYVFGKDSRPGSLRDKRRHSGSLSRKSSEKKRRSEKDDHSRGRDVTPQELEMFGEQSGTSQYLSAESEGLKRASIKSEIEAMSERLEKLEEFEKLMGEKIITGELLDGFDHKTDESRSNKNVAKEVFEDKRGFGAMQETSSLLLENMESLGSHSLRETAIDDIEIVADEGAEGYLVNPFSNIGDLSKIQNNQAATTADEVNVFGGEKFIGIEMAEMVLEAADTFSDVESLTIAAEKVESGSLQTAPQENLQVAQEEIKNVGKNETKKSLVKKELLSTDVSSPTSSITSNQKDEQETVYLKGELYSETIEVAEQANEYTNRDEPSGAISKDVDQTQTTKKNSKQELPKEKVMQDVCSTQLILESDNSHKKEIQAFQKEEASKTNIITEGQQAPFTGSGAMLTQQAEQKECDLSEKEPVFIEKQEKTVKDSNERDKVKSEKEVKQKDANQTTENISEVKGTNEKETKEIEEKGRKEKTEEAKFKPENEGKEKEVKVKSEKEAKEKAEKDEKEKAEPQTKQKDAKRKADKEAKEKTEKEAIEKTENEVKEKEAKVKTEKDAKEKEVKAEKEPQGKAEKEAKEKESQGKAEKEAKEKEAKIIAENEAKEKAEKVVEETQAKTEAEMEAKEKDDKMRAAEEKEAKENAQKEAKEKEAKEKAEKEAQEREAKLEAEKKVKEKAEKEAKEKEAKLKAEKEAKEKAEKVAKEKAEKEAKEKAEKDAREKAEKDAKDKEAKLKAEKEAKEKAEKEAKEKAEKEAKDKEAKLKAEKKAKEKAEKEAKEKAEKEAKDKEAKLKAEKEAKEKAEKEAKEKAEKEAKEKAEKEAKDKEAKLKAEKEAKEKAEKEAKEKAEKEAKEKAGKEAKEKAEKEAKDKEAKLKAEKEAKEKAEKEAKEKAEKEAKDNETKLKAEKEAKEKAEKEAKEKAEKEAKAKAEKEAKEKAEKEAKEKAEKEAKEKAEKEAKEKAEKEAKEKAEKEAKDKEAKLKAEKEAKGRAEREAKEKAEKEAKEKAEKEANENEAKLKAEKDAKEKAEKQAKEKAEKEAKEKAENDAKEKEAKLKAEKEAKEKAEKEAKEKEAKLKAEKDAKEKAEKQAKEKAENDAKEKEAKLKAEKEAKDKAAKEAKEKAEKEAKEKEAKLKAENEAKEKAEKEAKEKTEKEAKEREAKLKAEKEAKEKAEKEAKEKVEKEAKQKEAKLEAEKEAKEKAEKEAKEKADKDAKIKSENGGKEKAAKEVKEKAEIEAKEKEKAENEAKEKEKDAKMKAEKDANGKAEKEAKDKAEKEKAEEAKVKAEKEKAEEAKVKAEKEAELNAEKEVKKMEGKDAAEKEAKGKTEKEAKEKAEVETKESQVQDSKRLSLDDPGKLSKGVKKVNKIELQQIKVEDNDISESIQSSDSGKKSIDGSVVDSRKSSTKDIQKLDEVSAKRKSSTPSLKSSSSDDKSDTVENKSKKSQKRKESVGSQPVSPKRIEAVETQKVSDLTELKQTTIQDQHAENKQLIGTDQKEHEKNVGVQKVATDNKTTNKITEIPFSKTEDIEIAGKTKSPCSNYTDNSIPKTQIKEPPLTMKVSETAEDNNKNVPSKSALTATTPQREEETPPMEKVSASSNDPLKSTIGSSSSGTNYYSGVVGEVSSTNFGSYSKARHERDSFVPQSENRTEQAIHTSSSELDHYHSKRIPRGYDTMESTLKYSKRTHDMQPLRLTERAKSYDHLPGYNYGQDIFSGECRGVVTCVGVSNLGGLSRSRRALTPGLSTGVSYQNLSTRPRDSTPCPTGHSMSLLTMEDIALMEQTHQFSRELRQEQIKSMTKSWKSEFKEGDESSSNFYNDALLSRGGRPAPPPRSKRRNNYQVKICSEAEDIYSSGGKRDHGFGLCSMPSYFTTPSVGHSYFSQTLSNATSAVAGSFLALDEANRLKKPRFSMKLQNRTTPENTEVVKLACTVFGTPDPSIQWYKNGLPIFSDRQKYFITSSCGVTTLDIHNIERNDTGEYTCFARNFYGKAASTAILQVVGIEESGINKNVITDVGSPLAFDKCVPICFSTGIIETAFPDVNELVLECQVKGSPRPDIMWMKNGQTIITYGQTTYGRFRADCSNIFETGKCRLIIQRPRESDSGVYTCVGRNYDHSAVGRKLCWTDEVTKCVNVKGGQTSPKMGLYSSNLLVTTGNLEYQAPQFVTELEPYKRIRIGEDVALTVEITGVPQPEVRWFHHKNSIHPIISGQHTRIISEAPGVHTLYIPQSDPFDLGTYTVRVINKYGMVESSCRVSEIIPGINDSPTLKRTGGGCKPHDLMSLPPSFVQEPRESILLRYGDDLVIDCEVEGWPQVSVNLYRGCRNVTLQPRSFKELDPPVATSALNSRQHAKFTLTNIQCTDFGMYTVEAKNMAGTAKAFVNVKSMESGSLMNVTTRSTRSMTPGKPFSYSSSSFNFLPGSTTKLDHSYPYISHQYSRSVSTRSLLPYHNTPSLHSFQRSSGSTLNLKKYSSSNFLLADDFNF